ncbi:HNH endonuclease [Micromonospora sp. LAH09]|uniref:HNH endonuclease n=1 Tax=Micromonospora cabrerizensis TaxID=2911213 RepID=UPI001EE7C4CD|nr:HNH endonuclease signature motif containing protein [Micromonospora cabrerizensis]MCG5472215.1 HNH endonuclease [Micromonospora cabrerizensis]
MGYDHPPRAIADIKDAGVEIKMNMVFVAGRRMARYELVPKISDGSMTGRRALPKAFKEGLCAQWFHRCAVCNGKFTTRELQADHRIPYRISGESPELSLEDFMPLCPSCNRAKSWSCENCPNWERRIASECETCLWGSPQEYLHIATVPERRLHLSWSGEEVQEFDRLSARARAEDATVAEVAKGIISTRSGNA